MNTTMLDFLNKHFRWNAEGCYSIDQYLTKAYFEYLELCDEFGHSKMDLASYLCHRA